MIEGLPMINYRTTSWLFPPSAESAAARAMIGFVEVEMQLGRAEATSRQSAAYLALTRLVHLHWD